MTSWHVVPLVPLHAILVSIPWIQGQDARRTKAQDSDGWIIDWAVAMWEDALTRPVCVDPYAVHREERRVECTQIMKSLCKRALQIRQRLTPKTSATEATITS